MNPVHAPETIENYFGRTFPDFWERVRAVADPDEPGRVVGVYIA